MGAIKFKLKLSLYQRIQFVSCSLRWPSQRKSLKKENLEKNTPVLSMNNDIETEFQSLFCTDVSNDKWIQSNIVEANFCFHRISVFGVRFLLVENRFFPGHFPGRIPGHVADPTSSSVQ